MIESLYVFAAAVLGDRGSIGYQGINNTNAATTNLLNTIFLWAGILAVLALIVAAFVYVLSQGDSARVAQAKTAIIGAIVGLVIVIMSAGILNFVVDSIG